MATVSLKDLIGYVSLTSMVNTNTPDLPRRLPPKFYSGTPEKVEGDAFRYTLFTSGRTTARLTNYGSPSVPRQLRPIGSRDAKLFNTDENITFDGIVLEALRNFENYNLQEKGKEYVTMQIAEFRRNFKHLRDIQALLALTQGVVYRNDAGDILPSSAGATITTDFGVSASNQGQISTFTGISGTWNSPVCNIPLQLQTVKIKAQQANGYIPTTILYGKNIPTMLTNNSYVQPYLARTPDAAKSIVQDGFIPPTYQLFEYDWYPISDAGFVQAGTYQLPINDNAIVFVPECDSSWWGWAEGSKLIPASLDVSPSLEAMLGNMVKIYGSYAYSKITDDPVRGTCISGDTFLAYMKNPDVVYQLLAA